MAITRWAGTLRSLEPLFGTRIELLDEASLQRLVDGGVSEGERLEFKEQMVEEQKLAVEVAAMANSLGGLLIIGIAEDTRNGGVRANRAANLHPIELVKGAEPLEDWVMKTVVQNVAPWLDIEITTISSMREPSKGYVAIAVPRGDQAPYTSSVKDGRFDYKRRRGTSASPMSEAEVSRAFSERGILRAERLATHRCLVDSNRQSASLPPEAQIRATVFFTPEHPAHIEYRSTTTAELVSWLQEPAEVACLRLYQPDTFNEQRVEPMVHRDEIVVRLERTDHVYFRSLTDGSCAVQFQWEVHCDQTDPLRRAFVVNVVTELELVFEFGRALRRAAAHAQRAGTFGTAMATIGIQAGSEIGCASWSSTTQHWFRLGGSRSIANSPLYSQISSANIEDVAASERTANHLAWTMLNELFRAQFGVPVVSVMDYDGSYILANTGSEGETVVETVDPVDSDVRHYHDLNGDRLGSVRQTGREWHDCETPGRDFLSLDEVKQSFGSELYQRILNQRS
jgi:Putative DNA-binding domain